MRGALSRIPLGRALIALGVVLVLINIASGVWDVRTAHERTEHRAQRDFTNVTRVLAEQSAAALEAADLVLRDAMRRGVTDASRLPHLAAYAAGRRLESSAAIAMRGLAIPLFPGLSDGEQDRVVETVRAVIA